MSISSTTNTTSSIKPNPSKAPETTEISSKLTDELRRSRQTQTSGATNQELFTKKGYSVESRIITNSQARKTENALLYTKGEDQYIEILDADSNKTNNKIYKLTPNNSSLGLTGNIAGREALIQGNIIIPKQGGGPDRYFGVSEINGSRSGSDEFTPSPAPICPPGTPPWKC